MAFCAFDGARPLGDRPKCPRAHRAGPFSEKAPSGADARAHENWRQGAARYHAANALRLLLALALAVCLLHVWSDRIMDTGLVPLDEYDGKLPFATMRELAAFDGAAVTARRETMRGLRFNSVEDHSDWLAPRCISYHEVADFPAPTERRCVAGCTSTTSRPPPRGLRTGSCRSAGGMTGLRSTTGRLTRPRSRPMRSPPMKARSTSPRCSSGAETCSCAPIFISLTTPAASRSRRIRGARCWRRAFRRHKASQNRASRY